MFERDYLMRLLAEFFAALAQSLKNAREEHDPCSAAERLEHASCNITTLDPSVLLNLSPTSIASILQISGVSAEAALFFARGMDLASQYRNEAGDSALATLRKEQAQAVAAAYHIELAENAEDFSDLEALYQNKLS